MNLFLTWHRASQELQKDFLTSEALPIFQCVITQREGEFAIAKLLCDGAYKTNEALAAPSIAILYVENLGQRYVIFKGFLSTIPVLRHDGLYEWELNAEPVDAMAQLETLQDNLQRGSDAACSNTVAFEAAFYDDVRLSHLLEHTQNIVSWHPATGKAVLSDIFYGHKHIEMNAKDVFEGSLEIHLGTTPLNAIDVIVEANWKQYFEAFFDLGGMIAKAFPQGIINTLTPYVLIKNWPHVGTRIGHVFGKRYSGYDVVKSTLTRLGGGVLQGYKQTTQPLTLLHKDGTQKERIFRYAWFKASLVMRWIYEKLCVEHVHFRVINGMPAIGGSVRTLKFVLPYANPYLESSYATTLFKIERGKRFLNYTKAVALAHMAGSSRHLEVSFSIPFEKFIDLDLDTSITLINAQLPGGRVTGKVIHYELFCSFEEWKVWVKIATPLHSYMQESHQALQHYNFCQLDPSIYNQWVLEKVGDYTIVDPSTLQVGDVIESIDIQNDGETQEQLLSANPHKPYEEIFKQNALKIHIRCKTPEDQEADVVTYDQKEPFIWWPKKFD